MNVFFRDGGRRAIVASHRVGIGFHHDGDWTFMAEKGRFGYWMKLYEGKAKRFEGPFGSWNLRACQMDAKS